MLNFLYQQLLELQFRVSEFLLYVAEDARVNNSFRACLVDLQPVFVYGLRDSIVPAIHLAEVVFELSTLGLQNI